MQDWNWDKNAWICSKDGREHHALANFCAVCGGAVESKPVDCMADIPSGESKNSAVGNLPVIMDQVDDLFNVFGQPLLVDKSSGEMSTYIEDKQRDLPPLNGASLRQVDFDRWWIYALTEMGTLQVFPTSALLNDDMLQAASWKQIAVECERIENIAFGRNRLFLLDQEALTIHMYNVDKASCDRYWKEEKRIFDELKEPYKNSSLIEEMIPIRGSDAYLGLIEEENRVAFLDLERGEKIPYRGTLGDTLDTWVGVMRGEEPSIWLLTQEGGLSALDLVGQQVLETPSRAEVRALRALQIESRYWYMAIERDRMLLFDPLDRQVKSKLKCSPGYFMDQIDKTKGLGGLVANFQKRVGDNTSTQFYLSRLDEQGGAHLRGWPLGEEPAAPPAGFGKYVYVLTRDHEYHLYRYDLLAV
jgi:hypothetical protein